MKTFQQFCEDAYQLTEVAATATAPNPLKRGLSALGRSPIINNPVTRAAANIAGPVLGVANRLYNLDKAGKKSLGPLERTTAALSAVTPPGISNALGYASLGAEMIPGFRKFDKQVIPQHTKAYKANPQGYAQMLGRSF
jgi:hypothetical protein